MVRERRGECPCLWTAIFSIAPKIGCAPQTLHGWVREHEIAAGMRNGITSEERDRIKALEREVKELRRAKEILKLASASLPTLQHRPPSEVLRDFVNQNRETYGVKLISKVLQIAPSGYRRHAAHKRNPDLRCIRAKRDDALMPKTEKVWQANMQV